MNIKDFRRIRRYFEKEKNWKNESAIHRSINYKSNMEVNGRLSIDRFYSKLKKARKSSHFIITWYSMVVRFNCDDVLSNQPRFYKVRGYH